MISPATARTASRTRPGESIALRGGAKKVTGGRGLWACPRPSAKRTPSAQVEVATFPARDPGKVAAGPYQAPRGPAAIHFENRDGRAGSVDGPESAAAASSSAATSLSVRPDFMERDEDYRETQDARWHGHGTVDLYIGWLREPPQFC